MNSLSFRPVVLLAAFCLVVAPTSYAQNQALPSEAGTLVVTNMSDNTATVLDIASREVLATLTTGEGPHEVATSSDGRWAVVTNYGIRGAPGNSLTVINLETVTVDRTMDLDTYERPHGIAFMPGDSLLVVTSEVRQVVVVVDFRTGAIITDISTDYPASHMLALVPSGDRVYTTNVRDGNITEINPSTGETLRTIDVARFVEGISVAPDGSAVWVGSNGDSLVAVIDVESGMITDTIRGFGMPYRLAVSASGEFAVISDPAKGQVQIFDADTRELLHLVEIPVVGILDSAEFPGSPTPEGVTISRDSHWAYVTLQGRNQVAAINLKTGTIAGYMETGAWPDGIAFSQLTR
jgi:YVTN family beta-propeller protein